MPEDLGISTGTTFNVVLLVFYVPYILVDVPSNLVIKKVRAGIYLPSLITAWGLVTTFTGFVKNFPSLLACRLLLGLCEGGILGGVILYVSMFYRRHQVLYRSGLFYCAAPLAGSFGGLLAGALGRVEYGGYNKWPWIFFSKLPLSFVPRVLILLMLTVSTVEGAATVVFGMACFFFMPDTPALARFLTDDEKVWALRRMRMDASGSTTLDVDEERFSWHWARMALKAPQTWFCSAIWFFLLVPLYV